MAIIVEAWRDNMGNIYAQPIRADLRRKLARHVQDFTGHYEERAFFQEGGPAAEFLEDCTTDQRRDIENGWDVRFRADPWIVGHWYGYDAHTVFE